MPAEFLPHHVSILFPMTARMINGAPGQRTRIKIIPCMNEGDGELDTKIVMIHLTCAPVRPYGRLRLLITGLWR